MCGAKAGRSVVIDNFLSENGELNVVIFYPYTFVYFSLLSFFTISSPFLLFGFNAIDLS